MKNFDLCTTIIFAYFLSWRRLATAQNFSWDYQFETAEENLILTEDVEEKVDLFDYMEEEDRIMNRRWRSDFVLVDEKRIVIQEDEDTFSGGDGSHLGFSIYDVYGNRRPTSQIFGHFSKTNNSFVVMAPLIARPYSVYRLMIVPYMVHDPTVPIDVKATMSTIRGGEITFGEGRALVGHSADIILQMPGALPGPNLKLHIEARQGGSLLFVNTTLVHPSKDFLTIVVSMARALFNGDQLVEFRVILLDSNMLPYQVPVDIYILDSSGYVVRRWVSRMPNTGVVDLSFMTPPIPAGGYWRVRVQAGTQRKDHPFLVIKYYPPRFEIMWDVGAYVLASDGEVSGEVYSVTTNDASTFGNLTLTAFVKESWTLPDSEYKALDFLIQDYIPGEYGFTLSYDLLKGHVSGLAGTEIKFEAKVTDRFTGLTSSGYAKTRIISSDVVVKFLSPKPATFRPGMPHDFVINVAYDDDESLDSETLSGASLKINAQVVMKSGGTTDLPEVFIPAEGDESELAEAILNMYQRNKNNSFYFSGFDQGGWYEGRRSESILAMETYLLRNKFASFRQTGVYSFTLEIPKDAATLRVSASFMDADGTVTGDTLEAQAHFSPRDRYLHVTSSTRIAVVGEYAIFHIRSNFPIERFYYMILSKGLMVHSATEKVNFSGAEQVATVALSVARNMYPVMTFVAFNVDRDGELVAESIKLPVEIFHTLWADITQYPHIDHSKKTLETFLEAQPGTYVGSSSFRQAAYMRQPRNRLTEARFLRETLFLEPFPRLFSYVYRAQRNSHDPPSMKIYPSSDGGGEALRTLQEAAIASLTDSTFETLAEDFIGHCEISLGFLECGDGTCFKVAHVCDGINDCTDGRDEQMCQYEYYPDSSHRQGVLESEEYLLLRVNFWKDFFDEDGSWAWYYRIINHGQSEGDFLEVPKTQDSWMIEGFATHNEFGFTIIPPIEYASDPPFFVVLEYAETCRRGEQISLRTAVFNSMDKDLIALIVLAESEDYEFIHVEEFGVVDVYKPRTSSGEHHHLMFIPAGDTKEIFIPIAVKKQSGTLEITVKLLSQVAYDEETAEIEITPEGAPIRKHTSALLDLKSRAIFYEFMDIPIDEIPEISQQLVRRFVYGSPVAQLTLSGDVFGPITEDKFIDHVDAFEGRTFRSTDGLAFNFGATIWTLHYLRLTNQLVVSEAIDTFNYLNVQLAGMLTRFVNGGFKMWHYSRPSVWLTAWCTNVLSAALLEDWENYIYIDPRVLTDSVVFLMDHQHPNGYFFEEQAFDDDYDGSPTYKFQNHADNITIGLTALATASIREVVPVLPGNMRSLALQAVRRATTFLIRSLRRLDDPYDLAITSWALVVVGASEQNLALSLLLKYIRPQDGFLYWSKYRIVTNARIFENNQRTFLLPKEPQEWDAAAVETTSYALLSLLHREGVTIREERIVNWLVSIRDWDFAFISTVDTVVALKALTEYCYRARLRDVTDLKVEIQSSAKEDFEEQIFIQQPFVSVIQSIDVPNPWGHLLLTGRGSGQAIAQMTIKWGVDTPRYLARRPPRDYFSLKISEYHHIPGNKSRITTTVCTRWLGEDISETSRLTMLEIEVPSGYSLHQPQANSLVRQLKLGQFPEMNDCLVTGSSIYFQFSQISARQKCFDFDIHRWHPVANLTFVRSATIFEIYSPEHFEQILINSTALHALDICEVCGSYQCPYCYFYNDSTRLGSTTLILFGANLVLLILKRWVI